MFARGERAVAKLGLGLRCAQCRAPLLPLSSPVMHRVAQITGQLAATAAASADNKVSTQAAAGTAAERTGLSSAGPLGEQPRSDPQRARQRSCAHCSWSLLSSVAASPLPQPASASCAPASASAPAAVPFESTVVTATGTKNPVRWNGWGFKDTEFFVDGRQETTTAQKTQAAQHRRPRLTLTCDCCALSRPCVCATASTSIGIHGRRYLYSGKLLPSLRPFMERVAGLDISKTSPSQSAPKPLPPPTLHGQFMADIQGQFVRWSSADDERLFHAHGHTCQEIYELRFGAFKRVPDAVVYPGSHAHVEAIVAAAHKHNVVLIPYGGGTSVSQALMCPENERRSIISLDMHAMNKIKWINRANHTACIEAGIVGKDLETQLKSTGMVLGHEPDSIEFSTLGGWIATRASGMRKNKYGNIEDIVVGMKVVTPSGTLEKSCTVPRMSTGPDVHEMILGSEGTLGVITEAIVRLRPAPESTVYGSMIFPNFAQGVACLHEIAIRRCAPVSIRLVDNEQFQFGLSLKPPTEDWKQNVFDKVKKWSQRQHAQHAQHHRDARMQPTTQGRELERNRVTADASRARCVCGEARTFSLGRES